MGERRIINLLRRETVFLHQIIGDGRAGARGGGPRGPPARARGRDPAESRGDNKGIWGRDARVPLAVVSAVCTGLKKKYIYYIYRWEEREGGGTPLPPSSVAE